MNVEKLSAEIVDTAFHLHKSLGPGRLESAYEAALANKGFVLDEGFRADLLTDPGTSVEAECT